jgi:two-component system, chemotaxis family, protein-glutamate methylesterase/glutaminase
MPGKRVKVLVVDDSAVMRQLLAATLSEDPDIEVVGTAPDPLVARDKIKELNPDVVTLDVEMPRMDGLTFLRKIMTLRPMPVVMVSTLTQAGTDTTLEALEIGAVDFVAKPHNEGGALGALAEELRAKVKMAASTSQATSRRARTAPAIAPRPARLGRSTGKIVTIGASTGGVEALKAVLMDLPEDGPPILVTQHMPERFTTAFAARLDRECPMRVCEAAHDQRVEQGNVYIAPGSHHLELGKDGLHYVCKLNDGDRVSGHKPSVDVLFRSAARLAGAKIVAAILTGMGKDGAEGMLELRHANAITIGQDEASSLVYGMPRVAFERGAVQRQYPLNKIGHAIIEACCAETNTRRSA